MVITSNLLRGALGISLGRAEIWAEPISWAMDRYEINTPPRAAAFIAQVAHESGRLNYVREIWGPTSAQSKYEGRADLGNTQPGDGFRYRGRGLIQITGRANYRATGRALGLNLEEKPELLEEPEHAASSAAWFWQSHGLNGLADNGEFEKITRRINGGLNGYDDRLKLWERCKAALAAPSISA